MRVIHLLLFYIIFVVFKTVHYWFIEFRQGLFASEVEILEENNVVIGKQCVDGKRYI